MHGKKIRAGQEYMTISRSSIICLFWTSSGGNQRRKRGISICLVVVAPGNAVELFQAKVEVHGLGVSATFGKFKVNAASSLKGPGMLLTYATWTLEQQKNKSLSNTL